MTAAIKVQDFLTLLRHWIMVLVKMTGIPLPGEVDGLCLCSLIR